MNQNWPTKARDMYIAEQIMERYASQHNNQALGLFELIVNTEQKQLNFRLSTWIVAIAEHFKSLYGVEKGDFVTRKIISNCLTNGQTLH